MQIEIVAVHGAASESLVVGMGYTGILVAFLARQNASGRHPGGAAARRHLGKRRRCCSAVSTSRAATTVLQGLIFLCVLASNAFAGRLPARGASMSSAFDLGWWGVALAIVAGAIRVSTPYLLVSLGEDAHREKRSREPRPGRHAGAGRDERVCHLLLTGSPWLGMLAAGLSGAALGLLHAAICNLPRVNDVAVGIALLHFRHRPRVLSRQAVHRAARGDAAGPSLGNWSDNPAIRSAFEISPMFFIGIALAIALEWGLKNTRWGLILRMAGESADAARAIGLSVERIRTLATMAGGFLAGVGGGFLSLYYPGNWNEGLSSGQGLMAIALVIFARWSPMRCFYASLLFGGASAIGPAVQTVGITEGYYLFYAAPYVLTLGLLIYSSSPSRTLAGAPSELSISR